MWVQVLFFARTKELAGKSHVKLQLEDGTDTAKLLQILCTRFPTLKEMLPFVTVAVNFEYVFCPKRLRNGDEVAIMPPIGGG
ncbi:hypothetical protein CBR_g5690 [Chara braunii]|uniref:Molybdopterin synthase sulfur carrier subunit n=1 Tax=Chara braunii TaxID=69332 RepID=A0A388JRS4_CHABU|nr:hypothetical protein CBR_g5690 [Chara braunii]|eukprot:GBG60514.1 hypothetical protein CBR_g5690 [Chara braunii]